MSTETSTPLVLTTTRTLEPQEVSDFLELDYHAEIAFWVKTISIREETQSVNFRYTPDDGQTFEVKRLTFAEVIGAIETALKDETAYLCCRDDLLEHLGQGCAQDLDTVLQIALLGELVYG